MKKIILTNRQKAIASLVKPTDIIADIGCDHGRLSVYFLQNDIAKKVIATDISKKSIEKANALAEHCGYADYLETRQGDGLNVLQKGEVKLAIIAGMGSLKIIDILKQPYSKDLKLILQPMSQSDLLRKWLFENNFFIIEELIARERNRFYEILLVEEGHMPLLFDFELPYFPALKSKINVLDFYKKKIHTIDMALAFSALVEDDKSKAQLKLLQKERDKVIEVLKCLK